MTNKENSFNNLEDIDWAYLWKEAIESKKDAKKDWNKSAANFQKLNKKDDYHDLLFSKLILDCEDSVLDLGCGEGSITIPLSKKVKEVTGIDSSEKMLELLNKRCEEQNIKNVKTILKPLENISLEEIGKYDIVLASRSLNGIIPIKETLEEINKIAKKYVFLTFFGPENWKFEEKFQKYINKNNKKFPGYNYIFNILYNMGIYANIERLQIKSYRDYANIEDAMNNGKYRLDLLTDKEKEKLKEFLKENLHKDPETGRLYNEEDKADWVIVWWEK